MKLKYIIVEDGGLELAVVFNEILTHADVGAKYGRNNIVGAGFVETDSKYWACYGESVSLDIKSRCSTDSRILAKTFGGLTL